MSIRQAAREFGLSRNTVRRMLQFSVPPGYERKKPVQRPKLGPWLGVSVVIELRRERLDNGKSSAGALFGFSVLAPADENGPERIQNVRHVGRGLPFGFNEEPQRLAAAGFYFFEASVGFERRRFFIQRKSVVDQVHG